MSYHVVSLVETKRLGSPARKAVMMYCANRANDDGSGIWSSKSTIADACELARRTVIQAMQEFVAEGLLRPSGRRGCANGHTVEYDINLDAIRDLPGVKDQCASRTSAPTAPVQEPHPTSAASAPVLVQPVHPTSAASAPNTSLNGPRIHPGNTQSASALEAEFERVWPHYPRKVGKGEARKAWSKARKATSFDAIAQPLKEFIRVVRGSDPEKIPHFSTWLNGERWLDDQTHARNGPRTSTDDLRGLATVSAADDIARLMGAPTLRIIGQ